ncbi:MAG: 5'-deoxyadenosine deaminase [Acidobacteria bacterium]|nr:5'-deoxyadenosine deaminase [Acidobacteriota bacterium]
MSEFDEQRVREDVQQRFTVLRNARIVTMNEEDAVIDGDILIENDRIRGVGRFETSFRHEVDLEDRIVCPGFIQTHVHLGQTLFRGLADDLDLLSWLRERVWPLEAAHTPKSLYAAALLGAMELMASGTTTVLTMETVRHTDVVFEAVAAAGLRATVGKCLMDDGEGIPAALREKTGPAMKACARLYDAWHGAAAGRLRLALAPRFALGCSPKLMAAAGEFCAEKNIPLHSHAAENQREVAAVFRRTGKKNVAYFKDLHVPGHLLYLAHCIWLDEDELKILADEGMHVLHCPSSNLKLGSGIAMVPEMLSRGISVSLGADGAPCNNNLDIFTEMRLAALIQKIRRGPAALDARRILRLATSEAATALGLAADIGSIVPGKKADLVVLERQPLHATPCPDVMAALVYAYQARDVRSVMVDGRFVYHRGEFTDLDAADAKVRAESEAAKLLQRAGF